LYILCVNVQHEFSEKLPSDKVFLSCSARIADARDAR
jgi:hypothetical protein